MRKRIKAGITRRVTLDIDVDEQLQRMLASSRQTLSGFVQDAIVQRLARYEAPADFIRRKREKLKHKEPALFDAEQCYASGWPKRLPKSYWRNPPADPEANFRLLATSCGAEHARSEIARAWEVAGLGEYTAAHWTETARVLGQGSAGSAAAAPADELAAFEQGYRQQLAADA